MRMLIVKPFRQAPVSSQKSPLQQCVTVPFVLLRDVSSCDNIRAPGVGLGDHMRRGHANYIDWYARTGELSQVF